MAVEKYRKRPVVVEAVRWTGDNAEEFKAFVGVRDNGECRFLLPEEIAGVWEQPHVYEDNHGQWIAVLPGFYVIKGTRGEFYPCDPAAFADTFEPVPVGPSIAPPDPGTNTIYEGETW